MKGRILTAVAALVLTLMTGCRESFRPFVISGYYELTMFAGSEIPGTTTFPNGGSMTLRAGNLSISASGRFELFVDRELCQTASDCLDEEVTETGTYDVTGDNLRLIMDGGGSLDGRFRGDRITLNDADPPSVWVRR